MASDTDALQFIHAERKILLAQSEERLLPMTFHAGKTAAIASIAIGPGAAKFAGPTAAVDNGWSGRVDGSSTSGRRR